MRTYGGFRNGRLATKPTSKMDTFTGNAEFDADGIPSKRQRFDNELYREQLPASQVNEKDPILAVCIKHSSGQKSNDTTIAEDFAAAEAALDVVDIEAIEVVESIKPVVPVASVEPVDAGAKEGPAARPDAHDTLSPISMTSSVFDSHPYTADSSPLTTPSKASPSRETIPENQALPSLINAMPAPAVTKKRKRQIQTTQTTLDFGQRTIEECKECSISFNISNAKDRQAHKNRHKEFEAITKGVIFDNSSLHKFKKVGKLGYIPPHLQFGDEIVSVDVEQNPNHKRKVQTVLDTVKNALGSELINVAQLKYTRKFGEDNLGWTEMDNTGYYYTGMSLIFKPFFYFRKNTCIGFLLAERIGQAYRAVNSSGQIRLPSVAPNAYSSSVCRGDEVKAAMGISRIWVAKDFQRQGIARSLMECARRNLLPGKTVEYGWIAFSQPTESGARFADKFFARHTKGWLVYDEEQNKPQKPQ
jgi:hypothetical protein